MRIRAVARPWAVVGALALLLALTAACSDDGGGGGSDVGGADTQGGADAPGDTGGGGADVATDDTGETPDTGGQQDVVQPLEPQVRADDGTADPANVVVVTFAAAPEPAWVVVHEDAAGTPGAVLGYTSIGAGAHDDVAVNLSRGALNGEFFWAMLHHDEGTLGTFEFPGDDVPWLDDNGDPIVDTFQVSVPNPIVTPAIETVDQELDPADIVIVPLVVSDGPGWVVIHEDDEGSPGAILGQTRVGHGQWRDVGVQLSRDAMDGETLWAMLHVDAGEDDVFEFPGADVPVTDDDGDIVMDSFVVTVPPAAALVEAVNQSADPADEVTVARVVALVPGWIVIHEDDDGAPGPVIGVAPVTVGENLDVVVSLDRDALDGETLWAMLHVDEGTAGTYEFPGPDVPVTDPDGDIVMDSFVVSVGGAPVPDVLATDQTADPADEVTVARVVAAEAGWIVIHEDDDGAPGPVIGVAAVSAGTNTDVVVPLDRDAADGETLWAMLHVDAGVAGTYEFPGPDAPVTDAGGNIVMDSFVVSVATGPQPFILAADQSVDPADVVVVAEVISVGPGFVVIHEDDGGSPGAVLGHTAVASGTSGGVSVTLSRDAVDGETLWAMLHIDAGAVGTYEFPGADVPARDAGGDIVMDPFVVSVPGQVSPPEVVANDQTADPANQVTIATVSSPGQGWIVIHEDDGGAPGPVIGFEGVAPGRSTNVVVTLDRDAVDGETLWAMLHEDAGQAGLYEFPGADAPVTDDEGEIVMDSFVVSVATVEPYVVVQNQTASPANQVVIAEAYSVGPGWMVIHEDSGGAVGAVIGHAALQDGLNTDVVVTLTRDAVDGETLYAMLHTDAGTVGVYEFPGADGPVTDAGGTVIAPPFVVTVPAPPADPYLLVSDQSADPADEVFITEVWSEGPGWVVIHEDDGGSPGPVLGQTAVNDGLTQGVYVTLSRAAVDGETLHAMLHIDAGTVGVYEFPGADAPATDGDGDVVNVPFVVSVSAGMDPYVVAEDQVADPANEVTIAEVWSDGPGWMVIHEDDGGAPGPVIGFEAVFDGLNNDVRVSLDRDVVDGETLHAMLHVDAGTPGAYEFPGDDVPARDGDGDIVMDPFVVSTAGNGSANAVTAGDQTLNDLSTVVRVPAVASDTAGWMVIHADNGGAPGTVLGQTAVAQGSSFDVAVTLSRPAADGETLHAMLHVDAGTPGVYEFPGADAPAVDGDGAIVMAPFVTTVPADTPAVRFTLGAVGLNAYTFSVEPAAFSAIVEPGEGDDPTLTLSVTWRYEVANPVVGSHPFQLIDRGDTAASDVVLLSQLEAVEGSFEADAGVNWVVDGQAVRFTLTTALADVLSGYRCGFHTTTMRGVVVVE